MSVNGCPLNFVLGWTGISSDKRLPGSKPPPDPLLMSDELGSGRFVTKRNCGSES
jgi:hypothetical protein